MTTRAYATYEVRVDLDGDHAFSDASGDITSYVESAVCSYGMQERGDRLGKSAELELVLDNVSGLFSPERTATALSGFTKGKAVRLRMTYSATTSQLYVGRIDEIKPDPGKKGPRKTLVKCKGYFYNLRQEEVAIETQQGKRYDEIVAAILDRAAIYPPTTTRWFLGIPGFSELGETSELGAGAEDYTDLEEGINTFNYAGDTWHDGVDVRAALRDVIMAEAGWLWEDWDGKLRGWNRHHMYEDMPNAVDATITGADANYMDYEYGGSMLNDLEISFNPRKVSAYATDTLGQIDNPLFVPGRSSVTTTVRFDDGSGNRISGIDVITPVRFTDFKANTHSDGSRHDRTSSVNCSMIASADKADLTFENISSGPVFILATARVRGKKITYFGQRIAKAVDDVSVYTYGRHQNRMTLGMLDDELYADSLVRWLVHNYKDPTGTVRKLRFRANSSPTLMGHARDRRIGDRISLSETQTGTAGDYFIMGMTHTITPREHKVEWRLDSIPAQPVWLLGITDYGELGENTFLGV